MYVLSMMEVNGYSTHLIHYLKGNGDKSPGTLRRVPRHKGTTSALNARQNFSSFSLTLKS